MTAPSGRPRALRDIAIRVASGEQAFDRAVREFLDVFYGEPDHRPAAIAQRPEVIGPVKDAYLAAVAEHLARTHGLSVPVWTDDHGWRLREPFFATDLEGMKAILTVESPTAFRRRLLFVSKDALSRPRRSAAVEGVVSGTDQAAGSGTASMITTASA